MTDLFQSRRSIRRYTAEPVARQELEQIVEAAGFAPSGMDSQSWLFLVLGGAALEELRVAVRDLFRTMELGPQHPPFYAKCREWAEDDAWAFFYGAPALLIIANRADYRNAMPDSAAAAENALLKATELGLGSCWITTLTGTCDEPPVRRALRKLGLPDDYRVYVSAALGHAAEQPQPSPRRARVLWHL